MSSELLSRIIHLSSDCILVVRLSDLTYQDVNESFCNATGYTQDEIVGNCYTQLPIWESTEQYDQLFKQLQQKHVPQNIPINIYAKSGSRLVGVLSGYTTDSNGEQCCVLFFKNRTDIEVHNQERRRLEEMLLQAQKMEVVGQLTGGIVHDFNNLLTLILGYCELATLQVAETGEVHSFLQFIEKATNDARELTTHLLSFSRKRTQDMKPVDLSCIVNDIAPLLRSIIREDIEIDLEIIEHSLPILADSSQLDQILLNLALNAQDATPEGGRLGISVDKIEINSGRYSDDQGLKDGKYARLSVSDTGCGIPSEHLERVFEPFFTTKDIGKGTGLGLSIVVNIVKQYEGYITVFSEVGRGTTFTVYLPLFNATKVIVDSTPVLAKPMCFGTERILVVDDSPEVLDLVVRMLKSLGYNVASTGDPEIAVKILTTAAEPFDMLITDVVLPKFNGRRLYQTVSIHQPSLKVLYMSGYSTEVISKQIMEQQFDYIKKPISIPFFAKTVRDKLDEVLA